MDASEKEKMFRVLLLALMPLLFFGCGGGGGAGNGVAGGGIGGSGITVSAVSSGTVTNFGSVIVNDVEFDTANAEVVVGGGVQGTGDAAVTSLLSRGMVVRVEGRLDGDTIGTAARVVYNPTVEGPLESITTLDDTVTELIVMGQTVRVDDRTVFRNATLDALVAGQVLEVSGLADAAGTIFATYVNKKADSLALNAPVGLKGVIDNLDTVARRFALNSLAIDYSSATVSGFSGAGPLQGQPAAVKGRLIGPDTLLATSVAFENELGLDDIDTADIEGFITQVASASRFAVGTVVIITDGATVFKDVLPADLSLGTRLKVRGALSSKIVLADEIAPADKVKLESNVSSVDLAGGRRSLTLAGLSPVVVKTNVATRFTGAAGLDQITIGNHVMVFGRASTPDRVIATKILVKPASDKVALKGPVESAASPNFEILGVTVDTSLIPAGGFIGKDGQALTSAEFFAAAQTGDRVNAQGILSGATVEWNQVEID
jgi:hypothetical protein